MTLDSIFTWIVVGGVAGLLAEWIIGGFRLGCIGTVLVGILGAFVGGWLLGQLHVSIGTGIINNIFTAVIGAVLLLLILRLIRRA